MLKYLYIPFLTLILGCESESTQSNYDNIEQARPVYYKHDLSAQNANYQREINVHMDMLFHEEKYEVGDFQLLGSWFGKIRNNWISFNVTSTSNHMLRGFIITDTLFHSFKGLFNTTDNIHYDLEITQNIDTNLRLYTLQLSLEDMTLSGVTKLFDDRDQDSLILEKRIYEYDVTLGTYPEFSQRLITNSELEELSKDELVYITEEILAKHGLIFFNNETREMFSHKKWYIPQNYRVSQLLTKKEKLNLDKIYTFF